jgi:hypothetical protein
VINSGSVGILEGAWVGPWVGFLVVVGSVAVTVVRVVSVNVTVLEDVVVDDVVVVVVMHGLGVHSRCGEAAQSS